MESAWTIGANNDDEVGEDERVGWQFAGWCWTHDHFTEGRGTPVGWLPMLAAAPAASGVDTSTNEAWAARAQEKIAAMGSAGGEEDDMCPNCVTPWKCNGPHLLPPAASVSERARDDRFTAMLIGIIADVQDALGFTDEDKECSNGSLEIVAAIRELKEQALTQQRATPHPSADAVRELASKMYGGAVAVGSDGQWVSVRRYLLDELESLISGGSHA